MSVYSDAASDKAREEPDILKQHVLIQYLASIPHDQLHDYVMQLQSLLTLNIITQTIDMDLLKNSIRILDILYWVNSAFKKKEHRI